MTWNYHLPHIQKCAFKSKDGEQFEAAYAVVDRDNEPIVFLTVDEEDGFWCVWHYDEVADWKLFGERRV